MERNPVGKEVIHFSYGKGIIKKLENDRISVFFYDESEIKMFPYPYSIGNGLQFCEEIIQDIEYPVEIEIVEEHKDVDNNVFEISILESHWKKDDLLYFPYFKMEIKNISPMIIREIYADILFSNKDDRELWSEHNKQILEKTENPVNPGKTIIVEFRGGIGYTDRLDADRLPAITSEIYLNNYYCGEIKIRKAYSSPNALYFFNDYVKYDKYNFMRLDSRKLHITVTANFWNKNYDIFAPFLRLEVFNQTQYDLNDLSLKVVFINRQNNESWGEVTNDVIKLYQKPLKPGYKKLVFIKCDLGYKSQFSEKSLPSIAAKIYVNDLFYGEIDIDKSYEYLDIHQDLMIKNHDVKVSSEVTVEEQSIITLEDVLVKSFYILTF